MERFQFNHNLMPGERMKVPCVSMLRIGVVSSDRVYYFCYANNKRENPAEPC